MKGLVKVKRGRIGWGTGNKMAQEEGKEAWVEKGEKE